MSHPGATSALMMNFSFHEIYMKAVVTLLCISSAKEELLLFEDTLSIVKIHLLLNRFGESHN